MDIVGILGVWCVILSVSFVWPQAIRVVRHNTPQGVSPFGTVHAIAGSVQWFVFGLMENDIAVYVANGSYIVAQCVIASVLLRHHTLTSLLLGSGVILSIVIALSAGFVSSSAVGVMAIIISTSSVFPPVLHVYRTHNLHGLSVISLAITLMSVTSWFFYGLAQGDFIVLAPNIVFAPCVTYMLIRAYRWHHSDEGREYATTTSAVSYSSPGA